jgi:undecaprenyl diphosphate synthase
VAIIMDGNRRFARNYKLGSVLEGHSRGFEQLTKVLANIKPLFEKVQ